jgi:hypothetical protein
LVCPTTPVVTAALSRDQRKTRFTQQLYRYSYYLWLFSSYFKLIYIVLFAMTDEQEKHTRQSETKQIALNAQELEVRCIISLHSFSLHQITKSDYIFNRSPLYLRR